MSARTVLVEYLTALMLTDPVLADIKVIGSARAVDELSKPVLIVKTNNMQKIAEAPRAGVMGDFTLTLVSPHKDIDKAEDDLEARLEVLLPSLFTWGLLWDSADQAAWDSDRICYDIHTRSILNQ